jgi:hypothetical protein
MAARRDNSGIFAAELKRPRSRQAAVLDDVLHLSPKGLRFVSGTLLPEWTEVGVELRMPVKGARKDQQISCRGVVVECARRPKGSGYEVSLVFVDLSKRAQSQLDLSAGPLPSMSISIAR